MSSMRSRPVTSLFGAFVASVFIVEAASATVTLSAFYDPATGNITMQALDENGDPASLAIATFQFLSPAQYLSGSEAAIPSSAVSFATILNTDSSTFFEPPLVSAEIYATNFSGSTPLFEGSWDLGNVAVTGLSANQIVTGFTTDADFSPGEVPLPGRFLYQVQGDPAFRDGPISLVPEPTGLLAFAAGVIAVLAGRKHVQRRSR